MGHGTMYTIVLKVICEQTAEPTQLIDLLLLSEDVLSAEITGDNRKPADRNEPPEPPDWPFRGYDNYPGTPL